MNKEDRLWHASQYLAIQRKVILCALLISIQDIEHWATPVVLGAMLLFQFIGECLIDKERKKQENAP